ncbi:MAG TPA: hypothetical protein VK674_05060 [Candidatus Limnocylindria bacterium]|nr:hypothetical protein [Candidatus Limnocylindria bacterium]
MADALGDLLPRDRYDQPPEVQVIKDFVMEKYQQPVEVVVQPRQIIIQVKSAALAGALRMHLHELQEQCNTERRLSIRIRD